MKHHHHRHKIRLDLVQGAEFSHRGIIAGHVWPIPDHLQVLVYSADKQWYLQKDARVDHGGNFQVEVCFGLPDETGKHNYFVVAFASKEKLTTSPVGDVPEGTVQSKTISVRRTE